MNITCTLTPTTSAAADVRATLGLDCRYAATVSLLAEVKAEADAVLLPYGLHTFGPVWVACTTHQLTASVHSDVFAKYGDGCRFVGGATPSALFAALHELGAALVCGADRFTSPAYKAA